MYRQNNSKGKILLEKVTFLEKVPEILYNPSVHYRVNSILPFVLILSKTNPVHALPGHLCNNLAVTIHPPSILCSSFRHGKAEETGS
jgi:hypothetical protein